ncbi:MAG: putative oxidoreductase [Tardiphaga sp.]|jgi:predicted dinucleotide-binding enzyme|nr:putative oxidoreductase [Tardiphaga sp.]
MGPPQSYALHIGDCHRRVVFVASNDDRASATVKALAEQLGFSPILLGRIDEGGRLLHVPGPLVLHNLVEHPLK